MTLPAGDRVAFQYPQQAAEAIGAPVNLIVAAVNDGRLTTHIAGANKIVLREDLARFAASLPAPPKAAPPVDMRDARKTRAYAEGRAYALKRCIRD
jgi:hypothetical protein